MGQYYGALLQEVVRAEEDEETGEQGAGWQAQALRVHVRLRQGLHRQEVAEETREEEAPGAVGCNEINSDDLQDCWFQICPRESEVRDEWLAVMYREIKLIFQIYYIYVIYLSYSRYILCNASLSVE